MLILVVVVLVEIIGNNMDSSEACGELHPAGAMDVMMCMTPD